MAVPQRRISKTRKRLRRTHFKLTASNLVKCPHCGEMIKSHIVCPNCGYYDGKLVVKKKLTKEEREALKNENKKTSKKAKKEKKAKEEEVKTEEKK